MWRGRGCLSYVVCVRARCAGWCRGRGVARLFLRRRWVGWGQIETLKDAMLAAELLWDGALGGQ